MTRRAVPPLIAALLLALLTSPLTLPAAAQEADAEEVPHILMFSGTFGFRHGSIEHSVEMITGLAESTGAFTVTHTEDPAAFTPEAFEQTDIILFANTTGETPFTDAQKAAFEQWVLDGGGFMGIHAAADTNYQWPFYQELVGAAFDSHPHTGNTFFLAPVDEFDEAGVQVEFASHPIHADTQGESFPLREEYYRWQENPRGTQDVEVLLSLDETTTWGMGNPPSLGPVSSAYDDDQPVEWVKTYRGTGRVWYTNLGHYDATYDRAQWQARFLNAIEWVHDGVHVRSNPPQEEPSPSGLDVLITSPPGATTVGYVPSSMVMPAGSTGTLANFDTVEHNVQSRDVDDNRIPLFRSAFAQPAGDRKPIVGLDTLPPGEYEFFCSIHGESMTGTFTIV